MRRPLAVLALASFGIALVGACAPTIDGDDAESAADPLTRRPLGDTAPAPAKTGGGGGRRPPIGVAPIATVVAPADTGWCGETRFDLRRVTRSCEDLPGAFVEGGVTFVPGSGGRFAVTRPLAGTGAPAAMEEKTCSYTWQPALCALPDTAKLLVEEPTEQLVPRAPGCEHLPTGCSIKSPPPSVDGGIPTGLGRCEVCGFASGDHLWAILPAGYSSFSYWAGGQRHSVQLSTSQEVYDMSLGYSVAEQNVTLYRFDSAPETQP